MPTDLYSAALFDPHKKLVAKRAGRALSHHDVRGVSHALPRSSNPTLVGYLRATSDSQRSAHLLHLQRTIGNRATNHLLATPSRSSPHSVPPIQAKLKIGTTDDPHEREADAVATQITASGGVTRTLSGYALQPSLTGANRVQRKSSLKEKWHAWKAKRAAKGKDGDASARKSVADMGQLAYDHPAPMEDARESDTRETDAGTTYKMNLGVYVADEKFLAKSSAFVIRKFFNRMLPQKFHKSSAELNAPTDTGHAWVELSEYTEGTLNDFHSYGFVPDGGGTVLTPDISEGKVKTGNRYQRFELSAAQYNKALSKAQDIYKEQPAYKTTGLNCTSFARMIVQAAGQEFVGMRVAPGVKSGPGAAFTPNRLFNAFKRLQKRGKSLSTGQMQDEVGPEMEKRQQIIGERRRANQKIYTMHGGDLQLYDANKASQRTLPGGFEIDQIEALAPDAGGWRAILVDKERFLVKNDELEQALFYRLGSGAYHRHMDVAIESMMLQPEQPEATVAGGPSSEETAASIENLLGEFGI